MIEKILERLEEEKEAYSDTTYYVYGVEAAIKIVQEVAKEYEGKTVTISVDIGDLANSVEYGKKSTGKDGR